MNMYSADNHGEWPQNSDAVSIRRLHITNYLQSQGFRRRTAVNNKS